MKLGSDDSEDDIAILSSTENEAEFENVTDENRDAPACSVGPSNSNNDILKEPLIEVIEEKPTIIKADDSSDDQNAQQQQTSTKNTTTQVKIGLDRLSPEFIAHLKHNPPIQGIHISLNHYCDSHSNHPK